MIDAPLWTSRGRCEFDECGHGASEARFIVSREGSQGLPSQQPCSRQGKPESWTDVAVQGGGLFAQWRGSNERLLVLTHGALHLNAQLLRTATRLRPLQLTLRRPRPVQEAEARPATP